MLNIREGGGRGGADLGAEILKTDEARYFRTLVCRVWEQKLPKINLVMFLKKFCNSRFEYPRINYLMIHKFLPKPLLLLKFLSLEAHVPESDLIFCNQV